MTIQSEGYSSKTKAILVVSHGTAYLATLKESIECTENKIRAAFPDYEVRRAFTSRIVIKKLAEREGIQIDTEEQAIERLQGEGYREVYVQPLHVVAGEEYEKIKRMVMQYAHAKVKLFDKIRLGRPLLYYMGQKGNPDDYRIAIQALQTQMPKLGSRDSLVFMGHGGVHPSNAAYAVLQLKIEDAGLKNTFIYTLEGFPALDRIIEKLKKNKVEQVTLVPFMLVAGKHVNNDMAGEKKESAKSQLLKAGFKVDILFRGLGENPAIQDIYLQHLQDVIAQPTGHRMHRG